MTEHPAWLPDAALAPLGRQRVALVAPPGQASAVLGSVEAELRAATASHGGTYRRLDPGATVPPETTVVLRLDPAAGLVPDSFRLSTAHGRAGLTAADPSGLLYGLFEVVRRGEAPFGPGATEETIAPATALRMLDHWDNVDVHPVHGQVERGYAGGSLWFDDGHLRDDLARVGRYARLLAACGINRVCLNNVNVRATETTLLTTRLDWVAALADVFRPWGIRVHLAVNVQAPLTLGRLPTADPCDKGVQAWWADATDRVYDAIPDFGGYVVKADSEGEPGPFAYGRTHAAGANCLAAALAPHGGVVHWRAFVYNHRQDWRDRTTDRARAAYDHFTPLDGAFADNVILQVKFGPLDFQVREPTSPLLAAMPSTRVALECQVTGEYTGQQHHVYFHPEQWREVLDWRPWGTDDTLADVVTGTVRASTPPSRPGLDGGIVGVSNAGTDEFWTGHPLVSASLYGFGRLAWNPTLAPAAILDEWIGLTFPGAPGVVGDTLRGLMLGSRALYESYTAPLGVGFMVQPGHHYGPSVDGYEYSPWGTYHFADRDGVGADRTRATGTGYTGQYHLPWSDGYESLATCPDELLLFFHHVPYTHVLHDGTTLIQHLYDTHFAGARAASALPDRWEAVRGAVDDALYERVAERLAEQARSASEWCDQLTSYFWRHSGIPDAHGRPLS